MISPSASTSLWSYLNTVQKSYWGWSTGPSLWKFWNEKDSVCSYVVNYNLVVWLLKLRSWRSWHPEKISMLRWDEHRVSFSKLCLTTCMSREQSLQICYSIVQACSIVSPNGPSSAHCLYPIRVPHPESLGQIWSLPATLQLQHMCREHTCSQTWPDVWRGEGLWPFFW